MFKSSSDTLLSRLQNIQSAYEEKKDQEGKSEPITMRGISPINPPSKRPRSKSPSPTLEFNTSPRKSKEKAMDFAGVVKGGQQFNPRPINLYPATPAQSPSTVRSGTPRPMSPVKMALRPLTPSPRNPSPFALAPRIESPQSPRRRSLFLNQKEQAIIRHISSPDFLDSESTENYYDSDLDSVLHPNSRCDSPVEFMGKDFRSESTKEKHEDDMFAREAELEARKSVSPTRNRITPNRLSEIFEREMQINEEEKADVPRKGIRLKFGSSDDEQG